MLISLKKELLKSSPQSFEITLTERLPEAVTQPCLLHVTYSLIECNNYYLFKLAISGFIHLTCQRCLAEFNCPFSSANTFVIHDDPNNPDEGLENFEPLVTKNGYLDLETIVTDELHLYHDPKHLSIEECDQEVVQFIS